MLTLGSLFDGSGGFPLAASLCGIDPVWAAEIEPYPIAVTKSRFPYMIHLGDVSKINGAEIPPVDIISFGSPCQDLSVAGRRAGLKHEDNGDEETTRSGLFMEAVRIIREMREATNGKYPTFAVWENVPGAFSSNKGEDFRVVLEELVKTVEPSAEIPPVDKNGWAYADCYMGDGWSVAYRVFDAQYWGVPQRRRRIFLVADFGGQRSHKILFERYGLRGDYPTSRQTREGTSCTAENCSGTADCEGNCLTFEPGILAREGGHIYEGVCGTLRANAGDNRMAVAYSVENHPADSRVNVDYSGKVQCLTSRMGTGGGNVPMVLEPKVYGISPYHSNAMKSSNPHSGIYEAETSRTLDLNGGNPCCNQGGLMIVEPKVYESHPMDSRIKELDEVAPTVSYKWHKGAADTPLVCEGHTVYALDRAFFNQGQNALYEPQVYDDGTTSTLVGKGPSAVCYAMQGFGDYKESEIGSGLKARDYKDATDLAVYVDTTHADDVIRVDDLVAPLQARDYKGGKLVLAQEDVRYIVRRLTPTECARLQGFPDEWGHPVPKTEFRDDEYRFWLDVRNTHAAINGKTVKSYTKDQMVKWYNKLHTDSAEYKMWGNGIALPNALYVMEGIAECE